MKYNVPIYNSYFEPTRKIKPLVQLKEEEKKIQLNRYIYYCLLLEKMPFWSCLSIRTF